MATPTPQVLDDVQSGAPGEALHSPQLQLAQVTRQRLQFIGAPLPPVEKHVETWGVPCLACTLRSWATPGTSVPKAWGRLWAGSHGPPQEGRGAFWERLGALHLTNGQGPCPTQSAFLPLLQTFYTFCLPSPLRAPTEEMGCPSGDAEAPGKEVQLFPGLFAKISFQRRKMCCPRSSPRSPP